MLVTMRRLPAFLDMIKATPATPAMMLATTQVVNMPMERRPIQQAPQRCHHSHNPVACQQHRRRDLKCHNQGRRPGERGNDNRISWEKMSCDFSLTVDSMIWIYSFLFIFQISGNSVKSILFGTDIFGTCPHAHKIRLPHPACACRMFQSLPSRVAV